MSARREELSRATDRRDREGSPATPIRPGSDPEAETLVPRETGTGTNAGDTAGTPAASRDPDGERTRTFGRFEPPLDSSADADEEACLAGAPLGAYRLLSLIGAGGMGEVYLAEQERPRRRVAIKVLRPALVSDDVRRRFELEAELLARLRHPGIAHVYDAGTTSTATGSRPWFAMELVEGRPIDEHAAHAGLDLRGRLELVARVADAVQHAHQHGVVHRDLKPSNVLVTDDGRPQVLDFGVARATGTDDRIDARSTTFGQLVGTLSYMSPEQAAADPEAIDTRTDVHSLGVIAFELLSGRLPRSLGDRTLPEALRIITEQDPPRLGAIDRRLAGDVETIVGTAMAREPDRRYPAASQLADDIRRFLADEPIQARPPSARYQLSKFARRNRGLVAGATGTVLALVAGLVATSLFAAEARSRSIEAERALASAEQVTDFVAGIFDGLRDAGELIGRDVDTTQLSVLLRLAERRAGPDAIPDWEQRRRVLTIIGNAYHGAGLREEAQRVYCSIIDAQEESGLDPYAPEMWPALVGDLSLEIAIRSTSADVDDRLLTLRNRATSSGEPADDVRLATAALLAMSAGQSRDVAGVERWATATVEDARDSDLEPRRRIPHLMIASGAFDMVQRHDEARAVIEEHVAPLQELLPSNDPLRLSFERRLATRLVYGPRPAEAVPLIRRVIEQADALLPADSPERVGNLVDLAIALRLAGQPAAALEPAEMALAILELHRPGPSVDMRSVLGALAATYRALDRWDDAVDASRRSIAVSDAIDPARPRLQMGIERLGLAKALLNVGRPEESAAEATTARDHFLATIGPASRVTGEAWETLARVRLALGDHGGAVEAAEAAHASAEAGGRDTGLASRETIATLLAEILEAWHESDPQGGHAAEAERWRWAAGAGTAAAVPDR